jgi:sugar lactone lactonase YvrE
MRPACLGLVWSLVSVAAIGCGVATEDADAGPSAPDGGGAVDPAAVCEAKGSGTLKIDVSGLPAETGAKVAVDGAGGHADVIASGEHVLAAGAYTVVPKMVAGNDPIVRPVYTGKSTTVCVKDGQTVSAEVAYALVATSNKLWTTNQNGDAELLAFTSASLGAGNPVADVAARVEIPKGIAFDEEGGLWGVIGAAGGAALAHYPAATLASGGAKTPDVQITGDLLNPGVPGATQLAFDAAGNLWVSVVTADAVYRFDAAQLRASGSPSPSVKLSGVDGPGALAFDAAGNLWIAEAGKSRVLEYTAARLASSTSDPPDVALSAQSPLPVVVNHQSPLGLAFDSANNLWVNYNGGAFVRFAPAERTASATLTPALQIELAVDALAEGLAFDESGGLWFAYAQGQLARFSAAQLAVTGKQSPETILSSPTLHSANAIALYPAAATLPLFGKPTP